MRWRSDTYLLHPVLASGVFALPDDATVLIRIRVALGGEAEHGARLVQADELLELGVLGIEHEGLDQAGGHSCLLYTSDAADEL